VGGEGVVCGEVWGEGFGGEVGYGLGGLVADEGLEEGWAMGILFNWVR
jgi:hypothetical protein